MNKYKMISICSLAVACVLMLSLLLPAKTIANDKESIELNMHYENSQVTVNIVVNSELYTGVVCKYLMVDDALVADDLVERTQNQGTTINLDKTENNIYTTYIQNITKRFVVIYVSIGNCSICDYIDCRISNEEEQSNNKEEVKPEPDTSVVEEDKNQKPDQNKENETINQEQETQKTQETQPSNKNDEEDKIVVDNKTENTPSEFVPVQEETSKKPSSETNNNKETIGNSSQGNNASVVANNPQSNNTPATANNSQNNKQPVTVNEQNTNKEVLNVNTTDKSTVNTNEFQEIEKTVSTSTSEDNIPKTGEDDFIKIMGIIVFSVISIVSFYKYKTTK